MKNRKLTVFTAAWLLLVMILAGLLLFSCERDSITYCPFCRSANIREISTYNTATGVTEIIYQCMERNCGKYFGAGIVP